MMSRRSAGFTLIEILVASVILFMSISALTYIYRTAIISSLKSSKNVELNSVVTLIINDIQSQIRANPKLLSNQGKGKIRQVDYKWQSTLIKKAPAVDVLFSLSTNETKPEDRYYLWQVDLVLSYGNLSKDYRYQEISWSVL